SVVTTLANIFVLHNPTAAGQRSTIQGLVTGVHWGFGFGFGAIGGGMMYKGLGAKKCFLVSSALPTMALVLLCL
ncbi:unnamed protein product, partial [Sphacelaria rigidula]